MKVVMKKDENFKEGQQWIEKGLSINKEFMDEDFVEFAIYDELGGGVIANFTMFLNPTRIVGEITKITILDKNVDCHQLIKEFINYIYTIQSDFKVLVLRVAIQESGFEDFDLQYAGFYTDMFNPFTWYQINPNYEEVINMGTSDEKIKEKLKTTLNKMCLKKEKYIEQMQNQLENVKRDLEEYEVEGNTEMATYKRQKMEAYEAILNANDSKGLSR